MNERFIELLPWYVNGTISAEDRVWVDGYLQQHPDAERTIKGFRLISEDVRHSVPDVPASIGLAGALARIDATSEPSALQRWVRGLFVPEAGNGALRLRPAFAVAGLAVVVLQGGAILGLMHERESWQEAIRAGSTEPVTDGPLLSVVFASETTEKELRLMLVDVQGKLVGGPGQLGKYYLRVPRGTEDATLARLKANARVESVQIVPGIPAGQ